MMHRLLDLYARLFARPSLRKLNHLLLWMGLRGLGVLNYSSDHLSGEAPLARRLLPAIDEDDAVLLDIGANRGDFTDLALAITERLTVVCFEPHPHVSDELARRFAGERRVDVRNVAVGRETGLARLHDYADGRNPKHATLLDGVIESRSGAATQAFEAPVTALDDCVFPGAVKGMKIDVEGGELAVLKGAERLLAADGLQFVILEFGDMHVAARTYLKDAIDALPGFDVARILPGGRLLALNAPYRAVTHELFAYQNILFTRRR
ncbi:MAG: FkbM family methyltransferase [Caulobacterales bacterium]|nr:FkbM family methyltransferase [Caulobacterales bacterium]